MAITISGDSPNITTLALTTLSDGTNSTSSTNAIRGSAKAWVNFNGTGTPAIRGSFNVSSITDLGTGQYTVNFTTAMPTANYSAVTGGTYLDNNTNARIFGITTQAFTTSSLRIYTTDMTNGSGIDMAIISVAIFSS
jgi:hypothetical protein